MRGCYVRHSIRAYIVLFGWKPLPFKFGSLFFVRPIVGMYFRSRPDLESSNFVLSPPGAMMKGDGEFRHRKQSFGCLNTEYGLLEGPD